MLAQLTTVLAASCIVRSWYLRCAFVPEYILFAKMYCIAASIAELYPTLEDGGVMDLLMPKKCTVMLGKWCVPVCGQER